MAKHPLVDFLRFRHVRIRQLPGDDRIHVTVKGVTTSGRPAGAGFTVNVGEPPIIDVVLQTSEFDDYEEGTDTLSFYAHEVLAADIEALTWPDPCPPGRDQLRQALEGFKEMASTETPECGHEDVIDVSELDDPQAKGMCMWCPAHLVADITLKESIGPWRAA